MVSKMIILLNIYCKQPHYYTVSLITRSVFLDPKDSIIMKLACMHKVGVFGKYHTSHRDNIRL